MIHLDDFCLFGATGRCKSGTPVFRVYGLLKRHVTAVIGRCTESSTNRKQQIRHCPQCDDPDRGDNVPAAEGRH